MKQFSKSLAILFVSSAFVAACSKGTQTTYSKSQNDSGIINGQLVTGSESYATSIVGIYDLQVGAICTGSLYSNNTIITAAHCVGPNPEKMFLVFAPNMMDVLQSQDINVIRQHVRKVVSAKVNPGWNPSGNSQKPDTWSDIAVLKFAGTVPAGFAPATLLSDVADLAPNTPVTLAGYGVNEMKLTEVDVANTPDIETQVATGKVACTRDRKTCVKMESSGSGILRSTQVTVSKLLSNEVVVDQSHGTGACSGDSGGPAYVLKNGKYYLFGVTSRGNVGCDSDGIYTNILTYLDWIKTN